MEGAVKLQQVCISFVVCVTSAQAHPLLGSLAGIITGLCGAEDSVPCLRARALCLRPPALSISSADSLTPGFVRGRLVHAQTSLFLKAL